MNSRYWIPSGEVLEGGREGGRGEEYQGWSPGKAQVYRERSQGGIQKGDGEGQPERQEEIQGVWVSKGWRGFQGGRSEIETTENCSLDVTVRGHWSRPQEQVWMEGRGRNLDKSALRVNWRKEVGDDEYR